MSTSPGSDKSPVSATTDTTVANQNTTATSNSELSSEHANKLDEIRKQYKDKLQQRLAEAGFSGLAQRYRNETDGLRATLEQQSSKLYDMLTNKDAESKK